MNGKCPKLAIGSFLLELERSNAMVKADFLKGE